MLEQSPQRRLLACRERSRRAGGSWLPIGRGLCGSWERLWLSYLTCSGMNKD